MKKKFIKGLMIIVGTFLLCLSVEMFIIPYNILSGGVAGISVALQPIIRVSPTLMSNILIVSMLILGRLILGKEFFVNTALSSITYPFFTILLERTLVIPEIDPLLATFYGGLLGGIGIGIVFRAGGSTGGMDIPPLIVSKLTGIEVSKLVLVTDALTVLLGVITFGLSQVLLGLVSVFVMTWGIDWMISFGNGQVSKQVFIISDAYETILDKIMNDLDRGATILDGRGAYGGNRKNVILCAVDHKQYPQLIELIREIDENAFVITSDATDMHGEGFTFGFRI